MDKKRYEWLSARGPTYFSDLTDDEWRQVFVTGLKANHPVVWIQPVNRPDKRVTFAENVTDGTQLS